VCGWQRFFSALFLKSSCRLFTQVAGVICCPNSSIIDKHHIRAIKIVLRRSSYHLGNEPSSTGVLKIFSRRVCFENDSIFSFWMLNYSAAARRLSQKIVVTCISNTWNNIASIFHLAFTLDLMLARKQARLICAAVARAAQ